MAAMVEALRHLTGPHALLVAAALRAGPLLRPAPSAARRAMAQLNV